METVYYPDDDILYIRFSDKTIVREVSRDWHVNIAYAADGDIVEMTILDAKAIGLYPVRTEDKRAA